MSRASIHNERLLHDCAWALAHVLLDMIGHNYREEEQREIFATCYNAGRGAIESYCVQADRLNKRITPSKN